jgi:hypothetical protein
MTIDSIRVNKPVVLFLVHFIMAYTMAVTLWIAISDPNSFDISFYTKHVGIIYIFKDRYVELILILLSMSLITAWQSVKRAGEMIRSKKSGTRLVFDVITISTIIGLTNCFYHNGIHNAVTIEKSLWILLTYALCGAVIGTVIGAAFVGINFLWIKRLTPNDESLM